MPRTGIQRIAGTRARVKTHNYTLGDFDFLGSGDTKALTANGRFEAVYEIDIEDGVGEWFGRGKNQNPLQAQGFAGLRFVSDAAAAMASGSWRISVRNAQNEYLYTLSQGDLSTYDLFDGAAGSGSVKSRKDREPFPNQQANFETEPHILTLDLNVNSDITVDNAEDETRVSLDGYEATAVE